MAIETLVIGVLAFVVAVFLARDSGRAQRILHARRIIFGIAGVIFALVLLGTGIFWFQIVGFLGLVLFFLYIVEYEPYKEYV